MIRVIGSLVLLATSISADVTCGAGTIMDEALNQCVVAPGPVRRQAPAGPQLVTEDGNLLVQTTPNGRFGVRQPDGTTTYADEANAIPAAIQLGYNIFRDVQDLHDVISVRETLRGEIADATDTARRERTTLQNEVQEMLESANTSLSAVSGSLRGTLSLMATCTARGQLLGADGSCAEPGAICPALSSNITRTGNATFRGDLKEPAVGAQERVVCTRPGFGPNPRVLQCRRDGTWSNTTVACQNCSTLASTCPDPANEDCIECADGACTQCRQQPKGTAGNPGLSCLEILESYQVNNQVPRNGMYRLKIPASSDQYITYCDFETDGGGWTLISSVHEDNVAALQPNQQDRWTGQSTGARGARAWYDTSTFGTAALAAQADFKSKAYNLVNGSNTMLWHVSNGATETSLRSEAWARYHTNNDFLRALTPRNYIGIFSGNRRTMLHNRRCGVKLTVPIIWDTGNSVFFYNQISDHVRNSHMGGFGGGGENMMDYSIGCDGDCGNCMFAVCPGVSFINGCGNTEHACVGGAISRGSFQSDFTEWDHSGRPSSSSEAFGWSSGGKILRSAVLFFVR